MTGISSITNQLQSSDLPSPRHVAIIMDGNGRWATKRGLPRLAGHQTGAEAVRRTIEAAYQHGVEYLTLFGFSSENWRRPQDEVRGLMRLLRLYLQKEISRLQERDIRLRVVGERDRLPEDVVRLIEKAEQDTANGKTLHLTVALSYGGRLELVETMRTLARQVASGQLDPASIDHDLISDSLWTAGLPDPDLIIRTSGEKRISNFLLWQMAYAEFIFLDTLWPDFGAEEFAAALGEYGGRDRRYGSIRA